MAENVLPLNRFQSVITDLTGEEDNVYNTPTGVSTIVLSAQITNTGIETRNVTITITSNRELPTPQFDGVNVTGSFVTASALIDANKSFIVAEAVSYLNFVNNQREVPLTIDTSIYTQNLTTDVEAISYDISNNTTIRTNKAAKLYYDKNGVRILPSTQISSSYETIEYASFLVDQVLQNESVTGSANISRLYQTAITQSLREDLVAESGSRFLVGQLYDVIQQTVQDPVRIEQSPIELVKNIEIPAKDSLSPLAAGSLVLEEEYGVIISGSTDLKVVLSLLEAANE